MADVVFPNGSNSAMLSTDLTSVYTKVLSSTNVTVGAELTSPSFETIDAVYVRSINLAVLASQNGTLKVEHSDNGTAWSVLKTWNISGNEMLDSDWTTLSKRYYRVKASNGGTASGTIDVFKVISSKDENAQKSVLIANSSIQQPVDIQSRYSQSVLTHNNVSIAANGYLSAGNDVWIDTNGFANIGVTIAANGYHDFGAEITWSDDAVNLRGSTQILPTGGYYRYVGLDHPQPPQARYMKLWITNKHTSSRIYSGLIYLTT